MAKIKFDTSKPLQLMMTSNADIAIATQPETVIGLIFVVTHFPTKEKIPIEIACSSFTSAIARSSGARNCLRWTHFDRARDKSASLVKRLILLDSPHGNTTMMRGCALTIGALVAVMLGLAMFGYSGPQSSTAPAARPPTRDLTKPVHLAKDSVECYVLAAVFAHSSGQQAGGEAEGHRAVANLFVHPTESCYRVTKRERVRVLDATVGDHAYVKTKCVLSLFGKSDDCYVRPRDLEN